MRYFLGLDVGGTKTACVMADEDRILGRAQSGSTKVLRIERAAAGHLREVLDTVSRKSGITLTDETASSIGTSGYAVSDVAEWLRRYMAMWVGGSLSLLGDEVITLDAAFPGVPGVIVIAGTGSNVIGRSRDGRTTGAGGWGPALADGNPLGQQALRAMFAAISAGEKPLLLSRVLEMLGVQTRDELVAVANAYGFSFAQLMPVIVQAAHDGDRVAQTTLERGGEELAGLVLQVIGGWLRTKLESRMVLRSRAPAPSGSMSRRCRRRCGECSWTPTRASNFCLDPGSAGGRTVARATTCRVRGEIKRWCVPAETQFGRRYCRSGKTLQIALSS
jgi:N-acetylglucosamine kinase-like BadF-type ATPase